MLSPTGCVLAAGAVAIAPASLSSTAFVWAEALVTVTLLATLWLMLRFYDDPRSSIGCATAAMAALGFTGHGRMLPLVPVVLVLLLLRCVMARAWIRGAVITAVAVGTTLLSYLLRRRDLRRRLGSPRLEQHGGHRDQATPAGARQPAVGARPGLVPTRRHRRPVGDRNRRAAGEGGPPTRQVGSGRGHPRRPARPGPHRSLDPRVDRVHVGPHADRPPDLRPLQRCRHVADDGRGYRMAGAVALHRPSSRCGSGADRRRGRDRRGRRRCPRRRRRRPRRQRRCAARWCRA